MYLVRPSSVPHRVHAITPGASGFSSLWTGRTGRTGESEIGTSEGSRSPEATARKRRLTPDLSVPGLSRVRAVANPERLWALW